MSWPSVTVEPLGGTELFDAVSTGFTGGGAFGQLTVIEMVPEVEPPVLVAVPDAVLLTMPHVWVVVGLVMCTVSTVLAGTVPKLQLSEPRLMLQVASGAAAPLTVTASTAHDVPVFVGRVSVTTTPCA